MQEPVTMPAPPPEEETPATPTEARKSFAEDWWQRVRPYLLLFAADLTVCVAFWLCLVGFHWLLKLLMLEGWPGDIIKQIHSGGAVVAFTLFVFAFVQDAYKLRKQGDDDE